MDNGRSGLLFYFLSRVIPQVMVLALVGSAVGVFLNSRDVDSLTLDLPGSILLSESGAATVLTGRAANIYDGGDYIFVDARPEAVFAQRHIRDSLCLPYERFDALYPLLEDWTGGQSVLVYGSLREPQIADDLARRLIEAGEVDVYLYVGGIEGWAEAGLPLAQGDEGLLREENWSEEDWDTDSENGDGETGGDE